MKNEARKIRNYSTREIDDWEASENLDVGWNVCKLSARREEMRK